MAKSRKSIFDSTTSSEQIKKVAQKVQEKTIKDIPVKESTPPTPPKSDERPKMLYVDSAHHRQAKINATTRNMKLGEYVEWLIDKDKDAL